MIRLLRASAHNTGLPDQSVHMIATSPPYWGLRAYAGEQRINWPGVEYSPMPGLPMLSIPAQTCGLGEEATPEAYIGHLMQVMREMWRVMRDDGTCWVNLGDSYANNPASGGEQTEKMTGSEHKRTPQNRTWKRPDNLKPKDLCLIPARFALAAQADGWWVRSDIIWAKPNPMPESVTDRPTKAHEYVYLLAKSQRYFYDAEAVKEEGSPNTLPRLMRGVSDNHKNVNGAPGQTPHSLDKPRTHGEGYGNSDGTTRNRRTVWTIATRPYSGAHFATWPPDLVRPMIQAGTSARGVCPECGAPWERVVERTAMVVETSDKGAEKHANGLRTSCSGTMVQPPTSTTTGWRPTCIDYSRANEWVGYLPNPDDDPEVDEKNAGIGALRAELLEYYSGHSTIPATVLDPFSGSGTTGTVALDLGRAYIGIDIAAEYVHELAEERIGGTQIGFGL